MSKFVTYNCMLTFDDGSRIPGFKITMPKKPYWAGELEKEIVKKYNKSQPFAVHKAVKCKIFRNSEEGGRILVGNRFIQV